MPGTHRNAWKLTQEARSDIVQRYRAGEPVVEIAARYTTLSACLMLNHLVGPSARRNTELYSSALSRDQASLLYSAAAKMVRLNPVLGCLIRIREIAKELVCDELGTR